MAADVTFKLHYIETRIVPIRFFNQDFKLQKFKHSLADTVMNSTYMGLTKKMQGNILHYASSCNRRLVAKTGYISYC